MAKIQFFAKAGKQTVVYESSSDIPDNYLEMIYFGWQFEKWQVRAIRSVEKELKREVSDDIKSEWPAAFRTSKSGWADKMIEGLRISKRIGKRGDVVYGKVHVMGVRQRGKSTNKGDKSGSFRLRFFEGGALSKYVYEGERTHQLNYVKCNTYQQIHQEVAPGLRQDNSGCS